MCKKDHSSSYLSLLIPLSSTNINPPTHGSFYEYYSSPPSPHIVKSSPLELTVKNQTLNLFSLVNILELNLWRINHYSGVLIMELNPEELIITPE